MCVEKVKERKILARTEWHLARHNTYPKRMAAICRGRISIDHFIGLATSVENDRRCRHIKGPPFLNVKGASDGVTYQAILNTLSERGHQRTTSHTSNVVAQALLLTGTLNQGGNLSPNH